MAAFVVRCCMKGKDDKYNILLKRKKNRRTFIITLLIILIVFIIVFIKYKTQISSRILSDYYFTVGIIFLILGALSRTLAWIIHKRSILKPRGENENDVLEAKVALKSIAKNLSIIGFANIIMSLIFLILYYNL